MSASREKLQVGHWNWLSRRGGHTGNKSRIKHGVEGWEREKIE